MTTTINAEAAETRREEIISACSASIVVDKKS
jgi:hypothetical protein